MTDYRPGSTEERITSPTGGQKGRKSARFGGGDPLAMQELALVYGMGEEKYDRYNYLKGYKWSLSVDALFRHLFAFLAGEDRDECTVHPGQHAYDPETCDGSGLLHTAHAAWHAMTLTSFLLRHVGEDDRAPVAGPSIYDEDWGQDEPGTPMDEFVANVHYWEQLFAQPEPPTVVRPPWPDHADMSVDERPAEAIASPWERARDQTFYGMPLTAWRSYGGPRCDHAMPFDVPCLVCDG